jgi:mercuric ion transport protein
MKTEVQSAKRPITALTAATVGAGAALAGALASACCVTPVLATLMVAVLGAGGAATASSMKPYTPYFFGGSLLLLGYAFWSVYRPAQDCATGECRVRAGRSVRIMLWTSAAFWTISLASTLLLLRSA